MRVRARRLSAGAGVLAVAPPTACRICAGSETATSAAKATSAHGAARRSARRGAPAHHKAAVEQRGDDEGERDRARAAHQPEEELDRRQHDRGGDGDATSTAVTERSDLSSTGSRGRASTCIRATRNMTRNDVDSAKARKRKAPMTAAVGSYPSSVGARRPRAAQRRPSRCRGTAAASPTSRRSAAAPPPRCRRPPLFERAPRAPAGTRRRRGCSTPSSTASAASGERGQRRRRRRRRAAAVALAQPMTPKM